MARKKLLISYPTLNSHGGDISKKWYVEYSFRLNESDSSHRFRVYDGLCSGTAKQRMLIADGLIMKINQYLKSGEYLNHDINYSPVRESDTHRPECQMWMDHQDKLKVRGAVHSFLMEHKKIWRDKTYSTYESKLNLFVEYVEKELDDISIVVIERKHLLPFFSSLNTDRNLCKKTIDKYDKIIHALFDWAEEKEMRPYNSNPVVKIPNYGKKVDMSPDIFSKDDRIRLREAIEHRSPWLWLACEIQYYCAIRPGTELRLLKIKDIDREKRTITIPSETAKNKTTQTVGCPEDVLQLMDKMGVFQYDPDFYLFGRMGVPGTKPLGHNTMRNRFNEYRDRLGISNTKKFYSWKHTGAISSYDNGMPIADLKDHLRHSSIMTTEEYIKKHQPKTDMSERYIDKI